MLNFLLNFSHCFYSPIQFQIYFLAYNLLFFRMENSSI